MRIIIVCFLILGLISCSDKDTDVLPSPRCETAVVVDADLYNATDFEGADLIDFELDGDCLKVQLGVSGCDDNHTIQMITDGHFSFSLPPAITFDFLDENPPDV